MGTETWITQQLYSQYQRCTATKRTATAGARAEGKVMSGSYGANDGEQGDARVLCNYCRRQMQYLSPIQLLQEDRQYGAYTGGWRHSQLEEV